MQVPSHRQAVHRWNHVVVDFGDCHDGQSCSARLDSPGARGGALPRRVDVHRPDVRRDRRRAGASSSRHAGGAGGAVDTGDAVGEVVEQTRLEVGVDAVHVVQVATHLRRALVEAAVVLAERRRVSCCSNCNIDKHTRCRKDAPSALQIQTIFARFKLMLELRFCLCRDTLLHATPKYTVSRSDVVGVHRRLQGHDCGVTRTFKLLALNRSQVLHGHFQNVSLLHFVGSRPLKEKRKSCLRNSLFVLGLFL